MPSLVQALRYCRADSRRRACLAVRSSSLSRCSKPSRKGLFKNRLPVHVQPSFRAARRVGPSMGAGQKKNGVRGTVIQVCEARDTIHRLQVARLNRPGGHKRAMLVILDDRPAGGSFAGPWRLIRADAAGEVPGGPGGAGGGAGGRAACWPAGSAMSWAMPWSRGWRACAATGGPAAAVRGVRRAHAGRAASRRAAPMPGRSARNGTRPPMPARFARVKDYIAAGDIYQANLSFRARFAFAGRSAARFTSSCVRQSGAAALRLCR